MVFHPGLALRFDHLLEFMLYQFGSMPCTVDDVRRALQFRLGNDPYERSRKLTTTDLEAMVQGTIPVLVAKTLLGREKICTPAGVLSNWRQFVAVYGPKMP
jgi:hypothetical protein